MAADKPKTVKVEAIKAHSYMGENYEVGDTYDIDEQLADSVAAQGMALRTDRVAEAKKAAKAAEQQTEAQRAGTTKRAGKRSRKGAK